VKYLQPLFGPTLTLSCADFCLQSISPELLDYERWKSGVGPAILPVATVSGLVQLLDSSDSRVQVWVP